MPDQRAQTRGRRSVLGVLRRIHSQLQQVRRLRPELGAIGSLAFFARSLPASRTVCVRLASLEHPILLRTRSADVSTLDEVLVDRGYDLPPIISPKTIVDAGAHIGLVSALWATRYPEATIVAVEPEPSNLLLLRNNLRPYPNVEIVEAALWSDDQSRLQIQNPGDESWAFRVKAAPEGSVATISVSGLLGRLPTPHVDVLKVDIEGTELEVFSRNSSWVESVDTIIIELHDRLRPGCSEAVRSATSGFEFETQVQGDVVVGAQEVEHPTGPVGPEVIVFLAIDDLHEFAEIGVDASSTERLEVARHASVDCRGSAIQNQGMGIEIKLETTRSIAEHREAQRLTGTGKAAHRHPELALGDLTVGVARDFLRQRLDLPHPERGHESFHSPLQNAPSQDLRDRHQPH